MKAVYVVEYRPRGRKDAAWASMLAIRPPEHGAWVSDDRTLVQGTIDIYGYTTNDYRVIEYVRK